MNPMATRKKSMTYIIVIALLSTTFVGGSIYGLFYVWSKHDDSLTCSILGYDRSITVFGISLKGYCVNDFDNGIVMVPVEDAYKKRMMHIMELRDIKKMESPYSSTK